MSNLRSAQNSNIKKAYIESVNNYFDFYINLAEMRSYLFRATKHKIRNCKNNSQSPDNSKALAISELDVKEFIKMNISPNIV